MEKSQVFALKKVVSPGPVLIIPHDNPDPDALASGKALATLFDKAWGIRSDLIYSGIVARAENKVMLVRLLPEWQHVEQLPDLERYSAIVLVDTQPGAGNNDLPSSQNPHVVIDHHPPQQDLNDVPFVDIRPDIGSTSTLVYQYLVAAGVEPHPKLATALFYGLKTDTRGLSRGASDIDEKIYLELLNCLDRDELIRIEQAGLPQDYFTAFHQALEATYCYGNVLMAFLGTISYPDLVAEIADLLIRLDGTRASLCVGKHERTLYLSLRTVPMGVDAGFLIKRIVLPPGKAGGHDMMAGGQLSLDGTEDLDLLITILRQHYLMEMGETEESGRPLIA